MLRGGGSGSRGGGILAAVLVVAAVVAVAVLAASLLAPDQGPVPSPVSASDYLPAAAVQEAKDFRDGQRNLMLLGLAVDFAALGLLAFGRPRRISDLIIRTSDARPVIAAALAGAGISLLLALLAIPTGLIAHDRAVEIGLSTQSTWDWLGDRALGGGIAILLTAAGAAILVGLQRKLPRAWWAACAAVVVAYAVVSTWLAPVVLSPLFNDFEPLEPGPARAEASRLAAQADVDVGEIYRVDASRRSTSLNAYVNGIGSSKRIVLYDNLLDSAERPVMRSILAHELAHVANHDLRRGLLFVAIVAPAGMFAVFVVAGSIGRRRRIEMGTPSAVPVVAFPLVIVAFLIGIVGNQLSRDVERAADRYALELTDDPAAMIDLQRELALRNRSDPGPFGTVEQLFRTHPSTLERIGAALAYEQEGPESGMNSGDAGG